MSNQYEGNSFNDKITSRTSNDAINSQNNQGQIQESFYADRRYDEKSFWHLAFIRLRFRNFAPMLLLIRFSSAGFSSSYNLSI
jgi:hypothetical protein